MIDKPQKKDKKRKNKRTGFRPMREDRVQTFQERNYVPVHGHHPSYLNQTEIRPASVLQLTSRHKKWTCSKGQVKSKKGGWLSLEEHPMPAPVISSMSSSSSSSSAVSSSSSSSSSVHPSYAFAGNCELEEAELTLEDVNNLDQDREPSKEDAMVSQSMGPRTDQPSEGWDLDLPDTGMGLDGDDGENYDPVYARRALLEEQERDKEKQRKDVHDTDEYYHWDDPLTDHAANKVDPSSRQWGEAQ